MFELILTVVVKFLACLTVMFVAFETIYSLGMGKIVWPHDYLKLIAKNLYNDRYDILISILLVVVVLTAVFSCVYIITY